MPTVLSDGCASTNVATPKGGTSAPDDLKTARVHLVTPGDADGSY